MPILFKSSLAGIPTIRSYTISRLIIIILLVIKARTIIIKTAIEIIVIKIDKIVIKIKKTTSPLKEEKIKISIKINNLKTILA